MRRGRARLLCGLAIAATACSGGQRAADTTPDAHDGGTDVGDATSDDDVTTEELRVEAEGVELEGTLTLPPASFPRPVPAVVLVHGSGPQSRHETLSAQLNMGFGFDIHVFDELADGLARAGYAVATYDKRTCGPWNGCAENGYPMPPADVTPRHFLADALAVLDSLAAREDVDGERLVFLGHSQGGSLVPAALAARPTLAAAVGVAANLRPIDEVIAAQIAFSYELAEQSGVPEEQVQASVAELAAVVEQLESLRAGTFEGTTIGGASVDFWQESFDIASEAPDQLRGATSPALFLFGGYDWNVPASEGELWQAVIDGAPADPGHRVQVIDGITHALNRIDQPDWQRIQPSDLGRHVDDAVIGAIVEFLDAHR